MAAPMESPTATRGLMSNILGRGIALPATAASPMKMSPAGERRELLSFSAVASSPLPKLKLQTDEVTETPPRTPSKKQQAAGKEGKPGGAAAKGATPISKEKSPAGNAAASDAAAMLPPNPKAKAKAKSKAKSKAKAKAKSNNRRKSGTAPQFPGLPRFSISNPDILRRPMLPPKRAEDNYEMSDREESSDEIPMDVDRSKKHVPSWVEGFEEKATKQGDVDPGSVFGRGVPACDLDMIFPDSLYRKVARVKVARVRGSSCRWGPDRLKGAEIREYAQKMGQRRRLSFFQRASLAASTVRPAKKMRGGA